MFYYRIRKFPKAIIHLFLFTGQALCGQCREETHRAKMFSQHDIIHISMKAKKFNSKVSIKKDLIFATAGNDSATVARLPEPPLWPARQARLKCKQRTSNHPLSKIQVLVSLQQCPSHGEKLTMFCSKNSSMLCMKCFSEASLETRLHCVDIDIAYEQRKKSLDLAISVSIDCSSINLKQ